MEYRFGIPSYKRHDRAHTIPTLRSLGYSKEAIVVAVQTKDDYEKYMDAYGADATIIYKPAKNCAQNRNTLIDYFPDGERFIMLDDDVKSFCRMEEFGEKKEFYRYTNKEQLNALFDKMFAFCEKRHSPMWAWYPVPNAFFMSGTIDLRNIYVATIIGIENNHSVKFDETFDLKEDFEISLRLMRLGYNAVRFNGYTVEANHMSKGGCEDARKEGSNSKRCKELLERYPTLIKPSRRKDEVRFVGKTKQVGGKK